MQLSTRHLLGIKNLTKEDISLILSTAEQFKEVLQRPVKKVPSLRDVTIVNLFYENSTRTKFSFELAEKRLSADTINFAATGSSAAMVLMSIQHKDYWTLFLLKKRLAHWKAERWPSLVTSCTAVWPRAIFICSKRWGQKLLFVARPH